MRTRGDEGKARRTTLRRGLRPAVGLLLLGLARSAPAQAPGAAPGPDAQWRLRPLVQAAVRHDSNIYGSPRGDEISDVFYELVPAVYLDRTAGLLRLSGRLVGRLARYTERTERDHEGLSTALHVDLGEDPARQVGLHARAAWVSDVEYTIAPDRIPDPGTGPPVADRDARSERRLLGYGAHARARLTDKTGLHAVYRGQHVDYREDALVDSVAHRGTLRFALGATDRTALTLTAEHGLLDEARAAAPVETRTWAGRLGIRWEGTEKTQLDAGLGYRDARVRGADRPAGTDRGLSYALAASWRATERVTLRLDGRNETQLAYDEAGNALESRAASALLRLRTAERLFLSLHLGVQRDAYLRPSLVDGEEIFRVVDRLHAGLRADLRLAGPVDLFGEARYEDVTENVRPDFAATRLGLGLLARF